MVHVKAHTRHYPKKKHKKKAPAKAPGKAPKAKKKHAPQLSAAAKKLGNTLVPGLHPKKGDMASELAKQRKYWLGK